MSHDNFGAAVSALVVRARTGVTVADLRDLVAGSVSAAAAPRDVRFLDDLPLTHEGKADQKAFRGLSHGD